MRGLIDNKIGLLVETPAPFQRAYINTVSYFSTRACRCQLKNEKSCKNFLVVTFLYSFDVNIQAIPRPQVARR